MKKRVFSLFMALALCLSMLPAAAMADTGTGEGESSGSSGETHEHYLCGGDECTCPDSKKEGEYKTTFTAWTDAEAASQWGKGSGKTAANSLPKSATLSDYYYLTEDVVLEAEDYTWSPLSGMRLCLNGHSITTKKDNAPAILVSSGTFTLVDCKGDTSEYGKITHASGSKGHGVELTGGTFNMYGGNITGNNTSDGGGGVYMKGRGTFDMYGGQITGNSTTYCGGGVYSDYQSSNNSTFNMYNGEISGNTADRDGGGVYNGNGTFTMCGGEITGNNCISGDNTKRGGGGVYVGGTMTVSGEAKITDNVRDGNLNTDTGKYTGGTANNVYLNGSKTIAIDGELTGEIGVTKKFTTKETVYVATSADKNTDYTGIIVSDVDTYKVAHDSTDGTKLVLVENTPAPTEEHKHCICGETHTNVGDHTSESQTTFEKKLWMDGDTLKMGDKEWTLGEVERADSSSGDKAKGYALSEGTYYLGTDLKLNGTPILIGGDVKLCLNGHTIDQAYRSGAISSLIRVVGKNAHLTLTDCVGTGKLTGGKYGGVDVFGGCTLDMFGGTITGNEINGGVSIGQIGTFNMYDGKITGNRAKYGGGVLNGGTFNMYGGEISGNTATNCGGGVYVDSYSTVFKVSGAAKITGNTVDEKANNVYLPKGKTIAISGLTGGANIGVTTAEKPEGSETVTIASNVGELNYENYVKADDSEKYEVKRSNGGLVLAVKNGGTTPTEHKHFLCGGNSCTCPADHKEDGVTEFQPWTDAAKLPNTAGNYYLTGPVTLVDSYWTPADGTVLCLNGYSITRNRTTTTGYVQNYGVINITGSFTLADCKGEQGEYGKITHGKDADNNNTYPGRGVSVHSGSFTMYGGNITGNKTSDNTWGSGVFVGNFGGNKGSFTMYGGKISGNTAPQGGGVYVRDNFTMYGGEISGNEANYSGGGVVVENGGTFTMKNGAISNNKVASDYNYYGGGGVDVNYGGTFTMEGGTISGNKYTATDGSYVGGGGVHVRGNTNPNKSYTPFIMKGGTISDNETNFTGGGVYVGEGTTFTMEGGTISNNKAATVGPNRSGGGGGVYAYGSFTMTGGEISGNNCDSGEYFYGGGVYVDSSRDTVLTVSGNVKITGNTQSSGSDSTASNVYLPSGKTITIGGELTGGDKSIGVTTSPVPTEKRPVTIATAGTDYNVKDPDKNKFNSDKEGYEVKYDESSKTLVLKTADSDPQPGKVNAGVKITAENANDPAPTEVVYGDTFRLGATLKSTGNTQTSRWTWTSSDDSILAVTGSGSAATVRALKSGEATITVTYESDTTKGSARATITVNHRQISVKVDDKEMTVGGALPTFTVTYGNFASGDTADTVLETKTPSTAADGKTAGSFDITVEAPTIKSNYADKYTVGTPQKGTLTVNAAENPPQPSSGSSSRPSYSVSTPGKTENGSVSADVKNAKKGSTVTITVKPEDGFKLADLTVTDKNGNELALTDKGDGKYTFTMPAGKVEISAAFAEEIETSPFEDVAADAYYYEAVKWAAEQGITEGTGKGLFGPEGTCTRGQIVTFLWRAAGSPVVNYAMDLADVDEDAYYAEAVRWALSEGVTSGTTDTTFAPDATCTRAQAMTFLFKAMKAAAEGKADFKDVADSDWFASAVAWAVENGVTAGVGGGLFGPDNDCTRGQIVTFLWKLYAGK